ncbi:hypothetical protein D9M70_182700 [compost metagenome]
MQQVVEGDELVRRLGALARLGTDHVDPLHQVLVELGVGADGVIDAVAPLDQAGKDVVDVADGEGVICAVFADGAVLAGAQAVPELTFRITLAAEQHVLAMLAAGDQHQHRFRLGKAAEVLEVAVLAVDVLDVAVADMHGRGGQDGNAVGFHLRHQRLAPAGVFGLGDTGHAHSFRAGVAARHPVQCNEGLGAGAAGLAHSANSSRGATRRYSMTSI